MKKYIFLVLTTLFVINIYAQQPYPKFQPIPGLMSTSYSEPQGLVLDLGNGNSLVVSADNFIKIKEGTNINILINNFLEKLKTAQTTEREKDKVLSYNYVFYPSVNAGSKVDRLTIIESGEKVFNRDVDGYVISLGKLVKDTVNIVEILQDTTNNTAYTTVYSFRVNNVNDIRDYTKTSLLNNFVDKVYSDRISIKETNIEEKRQKGYNILSGNHVPLFRGTYELQGDNIVGSLNKTNPYRRALVLYGSVGAQNYKNHFLSNFSLSLGYSINPRGFDGESWTYSLFWNPTFSFEKNSEGNNQTFINHFVGLSFDYYLKERSERKINLYVPVSLAYLVKPQGNILEKNTFNLGFGGVKYGAMTLKPSMYFTGLFKNVTPSIQLNVGLGL